MLPLHYSPRFAEAEGFEPPERCRPAVFKTAAIDHSATLPLCLSKVTPLLGIYIAGAGVALAYGNLISVLSKNFSANIHIFSICQNFFKFFFVPPPGIGPGAPD